MHVQDKVEEGVKEDLQSAAQACTDTMADAVTATLRANVSMDAIAMAAPKPAPCDHLGHP